MSLLIAKSIYKKYGQLEVLKGIDLEIQPKEIVTIVGPSGAGKTTLLQILGTLDTPDSGSITLDKTELANLSDKELNLARNSKMGFVFQFHNLMGELTALENVCLPGWIGKRDESEVKKKAQELLRALNMESRENHLPSELSGGEQQRVAVARALINEPKIIFADEPTGNLDSKNADELHNLFLEIRNIYNCSFVIVTHNEQLSELADRTITIQDGLIVP
ncbi:lipoprotein-releasing system ATP-binding protein [Spirosomataceae bacterium TFI 002]|nr:lipoprotein-releasing system ATP-binding protein [Spirosomataceae bacterium TFI 002]